MKIPGRPSFSLIDHDGRHVTEASFAGKYLLVFFGFTNCAVVCPRALSRLNKVLAQLGSDADAIQPLYVTVDPQRDSAAALKDFLARTAPRFIGLTGAQEQIDEARTAFHVFTKRQADPSAPDGYAMPHTAITYLVGPGGDFVAHFPDAVAADDVVARLRQIFWAAADVTQVGGPRS